MKKRPTRYPGVRWHEDVLYYRVILACGKRVEIKFGKGTPKDAFRVREERQELEIKIRDHLIDPRQQSIEQQSARPAKDVLVEYVEHLCGKNRDKGHIKNTESFIKKGLSACGAKRILEIDAHKVNEWLRGLGLSARSKNARRMAMLAFCRWAADFGRVPRNPLPSGLVPAFDEDADRRRLSRAMDREESERLFAALLDPKKIGAHCHNGDGYQRMARQRRAFYVTAASTGLRWREVARLRWGDVDLDDQVVVVPAGQTKNGQQAELPLVGPVVDALRGIRPNETQPTDQIFSAEPRLKTWRADLRRAGLIGSKDDKDAGYVDARGRRLDRKCLRMSFCTWLKRGGVDLRDAQRLMRHSDPRLTSNVYSDLRVADLRAAVEKGLAGPAKATAPAAEAKTA